MWSLNRDDTVMVILGLGDWYSVSNFRSGGVSTLFGIYMINVWDHLFTWLVTVCFLGSELEGQPYCGCGGVKLLPAWELGDSGNALGKECA